MNLACIVDLVKFTKFKIPMLMKNPSFPDVSADGIVKISDFDHSILSVSGKTSGSNLPQKGKLSQLHSVTPPMG